MQSPMTRDRLRGYQQALSDANISLEEQYLIPGDFSLQSGRDAANLFLKCSPRPSAIFCMNDEMAFGLVQGLKSQGIRVPEDMSVAGFDDIEFAQYCDPGLTTISQPAEDIGRTAMKTLINILEGSADVERCHILPTQLIIRDSTAVPIP